jgi:hypothetical protein
MTMKNKKVKLALKRLGELTLESKNFSLDCASLKVIEDRCILLEKIIDDLQGVAKDTLISSGEISKRDYAIYLLSILEV